MSLEAKNLFKSYPKVKVLTDVSLSVKEGESVAICGRSGEGKTTLLHILGTLEEADAGEIKIRGIAVTPRNATDIRNRHIGFVFQSYNLLEDFTALENVLMPARIARQSPSRERGLELLSLVDLKERADFPAKLLSGGERQRVAIARALCNNPDLLLADEPSGNLDRANGRKVGELLLSLKKSLILVTHDPELAALCDRQYTLKEGQLL